MNRGLGLVLAGGGGKGAYHIGVWKALREYGVDNNIVGISGTSVGALNAILFAQDNYELAEEVWRNISTDTILKVDIKKLMIRLISMGIIKGNLYAIPLLLGEVYSGGFFSRDGLIEIIDRYINLESVAESKIDLFAATYNLSKLKLDYFKLNNRNSESIKKILLATSALPIIFDDEDIDGNVYIDGGVKDNIPIKPLYDKGIRTIIVVHLSRNSVLNKDEYKGANIIEIVPSNEQGNLIKGTLDFSNEGINKRINQGYEDTTKILKPIYEMGVTQSKIGLTLQNLRNDEIKFNKEKEEILKQRKNIKIQIEELSKILGR